MRSKSDEDKVGHLARLAAALPGACVRPGVLSGLLLVAAAGVALAAQAARSLCFFLKISYPAHSIRGQSSILQPSTLSFGC